MKRISTILAFIIVCCMGMSVNIPRSISADEEESRFETYGGETVSSGYGFVQILKDKKTGREYLFYTNSNGGGMVELNNEPKPAKLIF